MLNASSSHFDPRRTCATALNRGPLPLILHTTSPDIAARAHKGMPMPQQSLSDFASAMEAAGMLVRVKEEKRVDELPRVMEDHPTTAGLGEKITGCGFPFPANP